MKSIRPQELNYTKYSAKKYDADIIRSIPGHGALHKKIIAVLKDRFSQGDKFTVLDLGVGTGITSREIQKHFPSARFDVVDFSEAILFGAKKKLGNQNVRYFLKDYAKWTPSDSYDVVVTVIGFHHQPHKSRSIDRIYSRVKPGGYFLLGDLMTQADLLSSAADTARHFYHMVRNAHDEESLREWAHHHVYLNKLSTKEEHLAWLENAGFATKILFNKFQTTLILGRKPVK